MDLQSPHPHADIRALQAVVPTLNNLQESLQEQSHQHAIQSTSLSHAETALQASEQNRLRLQKQLEREQQTASDQAQKLQQYAEQIALLCHEKTALQQHLQQLLTFQAEEEEKELGETILSVAFDDTNNRQDVKRKYEAAVESFVWPIEAKYILKRKVLSKPQQCQFLLWVTFVGGRLPDEVPRFEEYAALAGNALNGCLCMAEI